MLGEGDLDGPLSVGRAVAGRLNVLLKVRAEESPSIQGPAAQGEAGAREAVQSDRREVAEAAPELERLKVEEEARAELLEFRQLGERAFAAFVPGQGLGGLGDHGRAVLDGRSREEGRAAGKTGQQYPLARAVDIDREAAGKVGPRRFQLLPDLLRAGARQAFQLLVVGEARVEDGVRGDQLREGKGLDGPWP